VFVLSYWQHIPVSRDVSFLLSVWILDLEVGGVFEFGFVFLIEIDDHSQTLHPLFQHFLPNWGELTVEGSLFLFAESGRDKK
jgi:hypothetical protein